MRFARLRLLIAATGVLLITAVTAYALAPLSEFDLTLQGVPSRVREKVRGEYEFPYVVVGEADTYYIENEETIEPVRTQFLDALENRSAITLKAHVLMVLDDLLVIDQIYALQPGHMTND